MGLGGVPPPNIELKSIANVCMYVYIYEDSYFKTRLSVQSKILIYEILQTLERSFSALRRTFVMNEVPLEKCLFAFSKYVINYGLF